jgi:N-acetylmuramoyl-L-alanine amidase
MLHHKKRKKQTLSLSKKWSGFIVGIFIFIFLYPSYRVGGWFDSDKINPFGSHPDIPPKIRILIVPGHEPQSGGTHYHDLMERDLAVQLGTQVEQLLSKNPRYEVVMTRDTQGWNPAFEEYFKHNQGDIYSWMQNARHTEIVSVLLGMSHLPTGTMKHNSVSKDVAMRLYGITKWANENNIDLMLHIHFDDVARRRTTVPGKYVGFTLYVPSREYGNSEMSMKIARSLYPYLRTTSDINTALSTRNPFVEDPRLIAVGANNTSHVASVLIEYGYIYEKRFTDTTIRQETISTLAQETYDGLENYYNKP